MRALLAVCLLAAASAADAAFVVRSTTLETTEYKELAGELEKTRLLQGIATELNAVLKVSVPVGLRYVECGEANAYYSADEREISMCLELLQSLYETLGDDFEEGDELDDAVAGAFIFFFFHELGHALIDVLEIPVTGREEDAADQLSAWLLIDNDEGDKAVLDAAISFYTDKDDANEIGETDFADEHSLDPQRYFNMICWVYGSDPSSYAALVDDWLPKARAEQCEGEYALLDRSWSRLLETHLKADADATTARNAPAPAPPAAPASSPIGRKPRPSPPARDLDEDHVEDPKPVGRIREVPFKDDD